MAQRVHRAPPTAGDDRAGWRHPARCRLTDIRALYSHVRTSPTNTRTMGVRRRVRGRGGRGGSSVGLYFWAPATARIRPGDPARAVQRAVPEPRRRFRTGSAVVRGPRPIRDRITLLGRLQGGPGPGTNPGLGGARDHFETRLAGMPFGAAVTGRLGDRDRRARGRRSAPRAPTPVPAIRRCSGWRVTGVRAGHPRRRESSRRSTPSFGVEWPRHAAAPAEVEKGQGRAIAETDFLGGTSLGATRRQGRGGSATT